LEVNAYVPPPPVQNFVAVMQEVVRASTGAELLELVEKPIVPHLSLFQSHVNEEGPPPRLC
jgi:hypothetical protein